MSYKRLQNAIKMYIFLRVLLHNLKDIKVHYNTSRKKKGTQLLNWKSIKFV